MHGWNTPGASFGTWGSGGCPGRGVAFYLGPINCWAISPEVETSSNRLNFSVFLMATSVSRSTSVSIASWTRATALEAVSHEGLQGTAETSSVVQISESTALTFTSNHACRGLWTQASESKNSVPVSKTVAMTALWDAFVKRGSPVQVRSSA